MAKWPGPGGSFAAIRKVPFYISQWKQFSKEIERVVEELSHLEQELRI